MVVAMLALPLFVVQLPKAVPAITSLYLASNPTKKRLTALFSN
jgi:hypothetical protein